MSKQTYQCLNCGQCRTEEMNYFVLVSERFLMCPICRQKTLYKMIDFNEIDLPQSISKGNMLWSPSLSFINLDEETLTLAMKIAKKEGLLSLEFIGEDYVKIEVHVQDCCQDKVYHTLISQIQNDEEVVFSSECSYFICNVNEEIGRCIQSSCSYSKCIFKVAGYIQYLIQTNQWDDVVKKIEKYR